MDNSNLKSTKMKDTYLRAKEKAQEIKSFYLSLMFYIIINSCLVYIWYEYSSHSIQWFWFPVVGWGIGILFKAINAFELNILFGKAWEQRQIKKYLRTQNHEEIIENLDNSAYQKAKKRVDSLKGFYSHLFVYLIVNAFIVSTIVSTTSVELFSFSALSTPIFWGIGLLSHSLGVFGVDFMFGKDWEEKKIKQLVDTEYREL